MFRTKISRPRGRFHRAETRIAVVLSTMSLIVASLTLATVLKPYGGEAWRDLTERAVATPTGPSAVGLWQTTLEASFADLASLPLATLPERGGTAFALKDPPDASTLATAPAAEPRI